MIKFWKSAAKRRSLSPIRPPEKPESSQSAHGNRSIAKPYTLATISENEPDLTLVKKSRLSMDLTGVLKDTNCLKYFIQYMETVSALFLIQFWLDVENFKAKVKVVNETKGDKGNTKDDSSSDRPEEVSNEPTVKTHNNNKYLSFNKNSDKPSDIDKENVMNDLISSECEVLIVKDKSIIDDAVSLFKKYIALEAQSKLELPESIRNCIVTNICQPDGYITSNCFDIAQKYVYDQMKDIFFDNFFKSSFYTKAQVDILTNGSLTLEDILYNESVLFYFMEYLEQESCLILLEFIIAISNFNENFTNMEHLKPELIQDDAITIYEKYFSLQATDPIGFPDERRLEVEVNICKEGGPNLHCFHKPFRIVFKTLSLLVPLFLESEVYYKYLNEMINSNKKIHKRTLSECSSETSVNTINTLLAMGGPSYKSKSKNSSLPDMTIDTNQLVDADALWQRKRTDGLSLGRINSLGQFESKFEPDPDKRHKSVLKKMFDKLVPNSTSELEEEMAWQVAQMIVKDITDLTLSPLQENC